VNPNHAGLLAWPTHAIAEVGFFKTTEPDDFMSRIQETINICLATDSPEELRESASKLKDSVDKVKESTSADFNRLVEGWRKEPLTPEAFSEMWVYGIAKRAKADPACRPIAEIISSLSAYHEFEEQRLLTAVNNPAYKPDKNDILDSEQLPYLGAPQLHFLTCDGAASVSSTACTVLSQVSWSYPISFNSVAANPATRRKSRHDESLPSGRHQ